MKTQIKKIKLLAIIMGAVFFTSCVSTFVANLQPRAEGEVEVYTTIIPSRDYIEIKYIQIDGSIFNRPEKLLTKLMQRAKKENADAIINVRYSYQWWWPVISGTAIKYKK